MEKAKKACAWTIFPKFTRTPRPERTSYAVHDTSLDIAPGEFVTLLGPPAAARPPLCG